MNNYKTTSNHKYNAKSPKHNVFHTFSADKTKPPLQPSHLQQKRSHGIPFVVTYNSASPYLNMTITKHLPIHQSSLIITGTRVSLYSLCNSHGNFNSLIHTIIRILRQLVLFVKYFFSSFPFFEFVCFFPRLDLTCEQALNLGDIVKSRLARGTREETRKRVERVEKGDFSFPRSLAASPLARAFSRGSLRSPK